MAVVLLLTTVGPAPAGAITSNAWTTGKITQVAAGTGHGTSSASFVNTANGFAVGDDSPDDGVVSSHDAVFYEVELAFHAGPARMVAVRIDVPEHLEWRAGSDPLCRDGRFVEVMRQGDNCIFTVPAGAVESLSVPLVLHARDTGGRVVRNQVASLHIGTGSAGWISAAYARPVTVVSAPAADVVLLQPPHIRLNRAGNIQSFTSFPWSSPAEGHFLAVPLPLSWQGFSPTSGVSLGGPWSGSLDVSAFPESTTWLVGGVAANPADGLLPLGTNRGEVRIDFDLNQPWPEQEAGTTVDYAVRLIVDPSSFSADGVLLNNGTGWQPGDGQDASFNTLDDNLGSLRGRPWANNDFSSVRVSRPTVSAGQQLTKEIYGPWNSSLTVWEDENILAGDGSTEQLRQKPASGTRASASVAPGTELTSRLQVFTDNLAALDQLVVGDIWDPSQQQFDPSRPLTVTLEGEPVPEGRWTAQWHPQPCTAAQVANPAGAGWTNTPQADSQAFRVVFDRGAIPVGDQEGAGHLVVRVPLTIRADIDPDLDGSTISNTMVLGHVTGTSVTRRTNGAEVILAVPRDPAVEVVNRITHVDGGAVSDPLPSATGGDSLRHRVEATVLGMPRTSDSLTPTITVELDRCVIAPVNTTFGWEMKVEEAKPGPSGRVCGDPRSTPAILTFRPGSDTVQVAWTNRAQGDGRIGTITYTTRVASLAPSSVQLVNLATLQVDEVPLPAHDEAPVLATRREEGAAAIAADFPRVEVGLPLAWTAEVYAFDNAAGGPSTDTVIVLPRLGDGGLFDHSMSAYDGVRESSFGGTYVLESASLDQEHSSARARLWFTTEAGVGLEAAGVGGDPAPAASPAGLAPAPAARG
ncbi:MAG: hypothetical protein FWG11_03845, partial [Promicromonosporaceae bacterium]|nr:hypothetical protein [Promicromonosporaceae bacterium]